MSSDNDCLWLEVTNFRRDGSTPQPLWAQLKGDRSGKEPTWWEVKSTAYGKDADETAREIFKALDNKRIVLAGIKVGKENKLVVDCIRIQFNDSGSR